MSLRSGQQAPDRSPSACMFAALPEPRGEFSHQAPQSLSHPSGPAGGVDGLLQGSDMRSFPRSWRQAPGGEGGHHPAPPSVLGHGPGDRWAASACESATRPAPAIPRALQAPLWPRGHLPTAPLWTPQPLHASAGILSHQVCLGALLPASTRGAAGSGSLTPVSQPPLCLRPPACLQASSAPAVRRPELHRLQPARHPSLRGAPVQVRPAWSSVPQPRPPYRLLVSCTYSFIRSQSVSFPPSLHLIQQCQPHL